ncbi:hypothetical protein GGI05_004379, partial [Coemansia sp. RSA 2603]
MLEFDTFVLTASFAFSFFVGWVFLARRVLESVDVSTPVSGPAETAKTSQLSTAMLEPLSLTDAGSNSNDKAEILPQHTYPDQQEQMLQRKRWFDAQKTLVYAVFSLVFAQGSVLFELVIFEISDVLTKDARWYYWRADLGLLLLTIVVVLPLCQAFVLLSNTRRRALNPLYRRVIYSLVLW